MRRWIAACAGLSLLLAQGSVARAQGSATADLYPPDTSGFPNVAVLLDVYGDNGIFASGLAAEALAVVEDGQALAPSAVGEMAVPVQIVVAVNQGPGLDARDPAGISRFERAMQVLSGWAQARPSDLPDDLSLVSQAGPVMNHGSPADFLASLRTFRPDLRAAIPNLQSLSIAIDIAASQTPLPGMKRAVLFITPHMDDANIAEAMLPHIGRALQNRVRVFVWFLDADLNAFTASAAAFNELAFGTAGALFGYSGETPFPDPESHFSPLRRVYSLTYLSAATSGGDHTLAIQVRLPSGNVTSNEQKYSLNVEPPNPIFVEPQLQITRQAPADDPFNAEMLLPREEPIEILVEFPDQHPRPLTRTTLYVDGAIADENTTEPFEQFTWDLSAYEISGEHQLVVEAVDSFGLSNTSMTIPVALTVIRPPAGIGAILARYREPITVGAIGLAGLALLAILLTGRLRMPSIRAALEARRVEKDPVTQPVPATLTVPESITKDKPRRRTARRSASTSPPASPASAFLVLVQPKDGPAVSAEPIPLSRLEILVGSDPGQCSLVLHDPSISGVHGRLKRQDDGGYVLVDLGSVAGTWVNFEPLPPEGHRLQVGDMVHFGRLAFRFSLPAEPEAAPPRIEVLKSDA